MSIEPTDHKAAAMRLLLEWTEHSKLDGSIDYIGAYRELQPLLIVFAALAHADGQKAALNALLNSPNDTIVEAIRTRLADFEACGHALEGE